MNLAPPGLVTVRSGNGAMCHFARIGADRTLCGIRVGAPVELQGYLLCAGCARVVGVVDAGARYP